MALITEENKKQNIFHDKIIITIIILTKFVRLIHVCTRLEYKFGTTAYGYKQYWNCILPFSQYIHILHKNVMHTYSTYKMSVKNYTNYIYKKIISLPVHSSKQDSFIKIWQQTLC